MSDDEGGYRRDDPPTSKKAARGIRVGPIMRKILNALSHINHPLNGWEASCHLNLPTITVVPRLAPMRRLGLITETGTRPGPPPKMVDQIAYVISDRGRAVLQGLPLPPQVEIEPITEGQIASARALDARILDLQHWAPKGLRLQKRNGKYVVLSCAPEAKQELERIKRVFAAAGITVL